MNVYAYFEEIPGIKPDTELLDCWQRSWAAFGWEPRQLDFQMARDVGPDAVAVIRDSPELGRGNLPEGYARATHYRWVAFAPVGGLIVDYDVINNGFTPAMMEMERAKHDPELPIFLNACPCCCAVYATQAAASKMLARILQHAEDVVDLYNPKHPTPWKMWPGELSFVCHDQAIFERFEGDWAYPEFSYVKEYTTEGWEKGPLIHFCNGNTPSPRGKIVRACGLRGLK